MYICKTTADSRVGCVRENNEDMLLVGDTFIRDDRMTRGLQLKESDRYLWALADGMGGHNCGEVASSDVLHNLQYFFSDIPDGMSIENFNESIFEWLTSMNNIIDSKGRENPELRNMGTTLVAFAYYGNDFFWMNCGDSRLYRLRDGHLEQLTTDHSLSNMMGLKTHSNVITNCIGGGCSSSYIDIVRCTDKIDRGDTVFLCSDGMTDMVDDAAIEQMLNDGKGASELCAAAEQAGGVDNISVIVIQIA